MYTSGSFSLNIVKCVKPVRGSDSSPATINVPTNVDMAFQLHIQCRIRPPHNDTVYSRVVLGMIRCSARRVQLLVQRDDDKHIFPSDRPKIVSGFTVIRGHPFACLMVETRPTLLEEHRCALRLVQGCPELRWILGKPSSMDF